MGKTYKIIVLKDGNGKHRQWYRRTVRRVIKHALRNSMDDLNDLVLPNQKSIINDYDYCDYRYYPDDDYTTKHVNEKYRNKKPRRNLYR